jgi:hypothetical protein
VAELAEKASRGTPEIPPEGLDVCGIGHVSAEELRLLAEQPADAPSPIKERGDDLQRRADAALAQVAARLAAGAEHQQVAARLLMGDAEGAAALAERSGDALAYQMALSACAMASRTAPSCARLSSPQWAMLDPSDARPWLRLASEAQRRGDTPRAEAALAEAAARPKLSRGANLLETQVAPVAAVVVPDATLRAHALVRIVGMDAALPGFDVSATLRLCDGESLKLPTRLPLCRTLARQLLAGIGRSPRGHTVSALGRSRRRAVGAAGLRCRDVGGGDRTVSAKGAECRWARLRIDGPDERVFVPTSRPK